MCEHESSHSKCCLLLHQHCDICDGSYDACCPRLHRCVVCILSEVCCLQAGSDSLLTSSAFVKLASSRFKGFEQLQGHKGVLFGLGVDGNNEMVLTDH